MSDEIYVVTTGGPMKASRFQGTLQPSSQSPDAVNPGRWITSFGVPTLSLADTATDQTTAIQRALDSGEPLFFPPGRYNYNGLMTGSNSLYGVPGRSFIHSISSDGKNTRWDFNGVDDLVVSGLTFTVDNKPANPSNDAEETDKILRFTSCANVRVERCDFIDPYGVPVSFSHIDGGVITHCRSIGAFKDSFYIQGTSKNITRSHNTVINGGDDAFAVVGYRDGVGAGQPENIIDIGNIVRGVKFARCFSYVGAKHCRNIDCIADGEIPSEYEPASDEYAVSGLYINSESSFDTYHNEDIEVTGMLITNCGATTHGALQIFNRSGVDVARDIRVSAKILNSTFRAVSVYGGAAGQLTDLTLNLQIEDNTDPNGRSATAGAGTGEAVNLQHVGNVTLRGSITETGGAGIFIGNTCWGDIDVKVTTRKINKSGTAGNDIIRVENNCLADLDLRWTVAEQAHVANSGTAYYIDKQLESGTNARLRSLWFDDLTASLDKSVVTNISTVTITPDGSPYVWENAKTYPVIVSITSGTVSKIERALMYSDVSAPVWVEIVSGKTVGRFCVLPGQAVRVTYTVAPTMLFVPLPRR